MTSSMNPSPPNATTAGVASETATLPCRPPISASAAWAVGALLAVRWRRTSPSPAGTSRPRASRTVARGPVAARHHRRHVGAASVAVRGRGRGRCTRAPRSLRGHRRRRGRRRHRSPRVPHRRGSVAVAHREPRARRYRHGLWRGWQRWPASPGRAPSRVTTTTRASRRASIPLRRMPTTVSVAAPAWRPTSSATRASESSGTTTTSMPRSTATRASSAPAFSAEWTMVVTCTPAGRSR